MVKNLTLVFNLWQQSKFIQKLQFEITNRLFRHYLKSDYMFFLQSNSGYLFRNLSDVPNQFTNYSRNYMIFLGEIIGFKT